GSVLTGSSEQLGRTRMVCCMYYTDVFVGTKDNIDNLNNALKAVLEGSVNTVDLTQLVHGLCLFMGYPSCLCKPKKSVEESLKKISKELKEELKNYECPLKPSLNCSSCLNSNVVCKCCVLDCISKVQKSQCQCVKGNNNTCQCSSVDPKRCCKDLLEKLKASLSLLNLKADMAEICQCTDENCCVNGKCTQGDSSNCPVCETSKTSKDYTVTGLGLLRPSPKRLAERLENFFGDKGRKNSCSCKCGTSGKSCCCLACDNNKCAQACSCSGSGQCDHGSQPQPQPSQCPCRDFCIKINSIKVLEKSSDMRCCQEGAQCHCQVEGKICTPGSSGKCCVVPSGRNFQQGVKCMIRRLVKFFNGLKPESLSSPDKCSKLCCEIFCVLKICEFLKGFYNKGGKDKCGKCKSPGGNPCKGSTLTNKGSSNTCCKGAAGCKSGDCCLGCQECDAIKFRKALEDLKLSSPCGQDLYRTLDDFLYYCFNGFMGHKDFIRNTVLAAVDSCSDCKKSETDSSKWQPCGCSSSSSSCKACPKLLKDSKLMSVLLSQYSSSYDSASAKWESLCPSKSGSCCQPPCPKCSPPSSCPLGGCCEKCPKRLCAKVFLGMLPCLYFGLKIVFDRCKYGSDFPDWYLRHITEGSIGNFLKAWGFTSSHLSSKNASGLPPVLDILYGSGKFKSLFDLVSKKYFSRYLSDPSKPSPKTVREMLLWLYGLPFTSGFHDLVSHCSSLCSPFGNSFNSDAFCYYIYTCSFILPVAIISFIEDSSSAQTAFSSSSEFSKFLYPSDPSSLADMFFDYIRKVYIAFNFLKFQCDLDKDSADGKIVILADRVKRPLKVLCLPLPVPLLAVPVPTPRRTFALPSAPTKMSMESIVGVESVLVPVPAPARPPIPPASVKIPAPTLSCVFLSTVLLSPSPRILPPSGFPPASPGLTFLRPLPLYWTLPPINF
ncbi:hypothetical protein X943_001139, partial [Babesia divergens]